LRRGTTTGPEHNRQVFDEYIQKVRPRLKRKLGRFARGDYGNLPNASKSPFHLLESNEAACNLHRSTLGNMRELIRQLR